ncbi:MAG: outer membrane protein assembly factor BamD [Candidatus Binatia bacterium]
MLTLVVACIAACSAPVPLTEEELISRANGFFEGDDFDLAIDDYHELLEQHPFSEYTETATLKIAHAYYLAKKYDEAVAAFEDFERLNPGSPELPFVEYTVGLCWLDQALSADRDKSATEKALRQFEKLRERYPDSIYGILADSRLAECKENLADHELYVAEFYARTGKTAAGRERYRYILENYPASTAAQAARAYLASSESEQTSGAEPRQRDRQSNMFIFNSRSESLSSPKDSR